MNDSIPPIDIEPIADDPAHAVSALVRSASFLETLVVKCFEASPEGLRDVMEEHAEGARLASEVVRRWRDELGIDD